jgi:hypothetical protein
MSYYPTILKIKQPGHNSAHTSLIHGGLPSKPATLSVRLILINDKPVYGAYLCRPSGTQNDILCKQAE